MTSTRTINPATGEELATYTNHTDDELSQIVGAAHTAFDGWRKRPLDFRAGIIAKVRELLIERSDDLAKMMTDEMGKLIAIFGIEVDSSHS